MRLWYTNGPNNNKDEEKIMSQYAIGDKISDLKTTKTITAVEVVEGVVLYTLSDGTVLPEDNIIKNR